MYANSAQPEERKRAGIDFSSSNATNKTIHQIVYDQSDTSAGMVNMAETMDHFAMQRVNRQKHFDDLLKVKGQLAENFHQPETCDRDSEDEQLIEEVKFERPKPSPTKIQRPKNIVNPSKIPSGTTTR